MEELKTYPGITAAKKWLSLTIVFPKTPSRELAYAAIFYRDPNGEKKRF